MEGEKDGWKGGQTDGGREPWIVPQLPRGEFLPCAGHRQPLSHANSAGLAFSFPFCSGRCSKVMRLGPRPHGVTA